MSGARGRTGARLRVLWQLGLAALLVCAGASSAAWGLGLGEAVKLAVARDNRLQAAGVRIRETEYSETAAEGRFDLTGISTIDLSTETLTVRDNAGLLRALSTQRSRFNVALEQPLVWGTRVRLGWAQTITATDNPFRNCVPGVASDNCYESSVSLTVTQPLLQGAGRGVTEAQVHVARADREVAIRQRETAAAALVESVVGAFMELAYARSEVIIRADGLHLAQTQLEVSQKQVEARQLAAVDLPVVEQAVAQRTQALFAAQQRRADRHAELEAMVGALAIDEGATFSERAPPPPGTAETAADASEAAHPDLAVLDAQLELQKANLAPLADAARARLDLSLVATQTGLDDGNLPAAVASIFDNNSSYYGLTLDFAFPFANRAAEGRLSAARLAVARAQFERKARTVEIRRDAAAAWRAVRTAEQNEQMARKVAELSRVALEAEQKRFALGRSTNLDVLRVQQDVSEAELTAARASADRWLAGARLDRLTGRTLRVWGLAVEPP